MWGNCRGVPVMRDDRRRLNLSFSLDNEDQRQAWEIVSAVPRGRITETVCRMLIEHKSQTELLLAIRQAVREELKSYGGITKKLHNTTEAEEAGAVRNDILGFLRDLQEEGDDD